MITAYVCSPISGDIKSNIQKAKQYGKYLISMEKVPLIPHTIAEILDDNIPEERELGLRADKTLIFYCDEMWVFGDIITEGMKEDINYAKTLGLPIVYVSEKEIKEMGVLKNEC